jgi:hypothetical protein
MSPLPSAVFKKVSCLAIVALMLWLGGFGCALCCSTGTTDLCCTGEQSTCSGPASQVSDCCKRAGEQCAASNTDSISQPPDGSCSLLPNQAASILTVSSSTSLFAAAIQHHQFIPKPDIDAHTPVYARSLLLANRGSTYLRCCVLLI